MSAPRPSLVALTLSIRRLVAVLAGAVSRSGVVVEPEGKSCAILSRWELMILDDLIDKEIESESPLSVGRS